LLQHNLKIIIILVACKKKRKYKDKKI